MLNRQEQIARKGDGLPYLSSRGDSTIRFNGTVNLPGEVRDDANDNVAKCRHFATLFVLQKGKKRAVVEQFGSAEGIRGTFGGRLARINKIFCGFLLKTPERSKYLVNEEQFGTYVGAIAAKLSGVNACANVLLVTVSHAMALHVERKVKRGIVSFNAKVFDPNYTACYKRIPFDAPSSKVLARLQLKDFLVDPVMVARDTPSSNALTMSAICIEEALSLDLPHLQFTVTGQHQDKIPIKDELHLALSNGLRGALAVMGNQIVQHAAQFRSDALVELLAAKGPDGAPGLFTALQVGHAHSVQEFADLLCKLPLTTADKQSLMASIRDRGTPGFFMAMQFGHMDSIRAFVAALDRLGLSTEAKVELLSRKSANGVSPLLIAIHKGNIDAVICWVRAIKMLGLNHQQRLDLLIATDPAGFPAVIHALTVGQFRTAVVGSNMFAELEVDPQAVLDLLVPYQNHPSIIGEAHVCLSQMIAAEQQRKTALIAPRPSGHR